MIELLAKIPSTAWVAIVTALMTSSLTLFGVRYTNRSNNERLQMQLDHELKIRREELIRARLEELYVESKKCTNSMITYYLPYRRVMKGELTYNEALDLTIKTEITYDYQRVLMLMDMYFPQLRVSFKSVEDSREKINEIQSLYKEQYKQGNTSGQKWLPLFQKALEELGESVSKFEKRVAEVAKSDFYL